MEETDDGVLRERLRGFVAILRVTLDRAAQENPGTDVRLGVLTENTDGSGHIYARFEFEDFLRDLGRLAGFDEPTPEDRAAEFLHRFGLCGRGGSE